MPEVAPLFVRAVWSRYLRCLGVSCACFVAVLSLVTAAFAESSVLLVVKGAADQDTAPFELRLRSEFAAEGLEVVTASGRSQQNLLDLEGLARRTGAVAALGVYVDVQDVQGRLWVTDANSNADLVRTLRVLRAEGDSVSVFALRAVEALRGARLELEHQRRRMAGAGTTTGTEPGGANSAALGTGVNTVASSAVPAPSAVPVPPKPNQEIKKTKAPPETAKNSPGRSPAGAAPGSEARWTVSIGAVAGYEQNGLGAIGAPALDVRYRYREKLTFGASFGGPFLSRRSYPAGVLQVDQELLDFQGRYRYLSYKRLSLEVFLSTGPSRFAVAGKDTRVAGTADSAVSLGWTLGAGLGSQLSLTEHWIVGLDLLWMRRLPAPWVKLGDKHVTGQTDSLILGKLGMGVVF